MAQMTGMRSRPSTAKKISVVTESNVVTVKAEVLGKKIPSAQYPWTEGDVH